jgi:hypothetical protein
MTDFTSGAPLVGLTVTVGPTPNARTCNAAQTQTLNVCGTVASTTASSTTNASGYFSLNLPAGTYMLVVGPTNGSYATLHRTVTITLGTPNALGTVKLTALDALHQAWLADFNNQRATVSMPTSFANLQVDEYAQEQANQWASDVANGVTTYGDAGYVPYQAAYGNAPGAMYGATGVLAETGSAFTNGFETTTVDDWWMSEKTNGCASYSGNWQTCPFAETTGHYINISNTQNVWVGLSESAMSNPIDGYSADVMIVGNAASAGPASLRRVTH